MLFLFTFSNVHIQYVFTYFSQGNLRSKMRNTTFFLMAFQPSQTHLLKLLVAAPGKGNMFLYLCPCRFVRVSSPSFVPKKSSLAIYLWGQCSLGTSAVFYCSIWRMRLQQRSSYTTTLSHEFSTRTIEGNHFVAWVTSLCMEDLLWLSLHRWSFKHPCLKQHTYFQKKNVCLKQWFFNFF